MEHVGSGAVVRYCGGCAVSYRPEHSPASQFRPALSFSFHEFLTDRVECSIGYQNSYLSSRPYVILLFEVVKMQHCCIVSNVLVRNELSGIYIYWIASKIVALPSQSLRDAPND